MDTANASMNLSLEETTDESLQGYGPDGSLIGTAWVLVMLGVVVNGLLCHTSPGLMLRVQSNPFTTQIWLMFGMKAQNAQTLAFVLYHQSLYGKLSHYCTVPVDFFAWTYITHQCLGIFPCIALVCLVVLQAVSSRFFPLIVVVSLSAAGALAFSLSALTLSVSSQFLLYRYMQLAILFGGLIRVSGHACEKQMPPMPTDLSDCSLQFGRSPLEGVFRVSMIMRIMQAVVAEISAGFPYRIFIPMLNCLIGDATGLRPKGLESMEDAKRRTQKVLAKGWLEGFPEGADDFYTALRRETSTNLLPSMALEPRWRWLLTLECCALVAITVGWFVAPNGLINQCSRNMHTLMGNSSSVAPMSANSIVPASLLAVTACLVTTCALAYVLLRMMYASSLDVRAFSFVLEGFTLCGLFLSLTLFALYTNGLSVNLGDEAGTQSHGITALFLTSSLQMVFSCFHFFFLLVEVPRMLDAATKESGEEDPYLAASESNTPARRSSRSGSVANEPLEYLVRVRRQSLIKKVE